MENSVKNIELKNNMFQCIRVTGEESQFGELKRFCGQDITITYESCVVDDYWDIELYDCLKEKKVCVPNYDYILKLPNGFTLLQREYACEYFNIK